jgi:hypothetical protein
VRSRHEEDEESLSIHQEIGRQDEDVIHRAEEFGEPFFSVQVGFLEPSRSLEKCSKRIHVGSLLGARRHP